MGDGELVLENSPFHQYLQEIGWNDTPTVSRTNLIHSNKNNVTISKLLSYIRMVASISSGFLNILKTKRLISYSVAELKKIRVQIQPYILEPHKIHVLELESTLPAVAYNSHVFFTLHALTFLVMILLIPHVYWYISCSIFCICSLLYLYYGYKNIQYHLNLTIGNYSSSFKRFKQTCRVLLSYLRDCQIARTSYAAGVTWSKLDKIEDKASNLERNEIRKELLYVLDRIYKIHKDVIVKALKNATMISELDSVDQYICLQTDNVLDDIVWESPSSHSLRYYLKLIEHASSEILWKLAIATLPISWPNEMVNDGFINQMFESLNMLSSEFDEKSEQLEKVYETSVSRKVAKLTNKSLYCPTDAQNNCQILHNLQLLHSSLNIATLRCLDTHSFITTKFDTMPENLSKNAMTDKDLLVDSVDITSTLSMVQLNVDMAQNILQTIDVILNPTKMQEVNVPMENTMEVFQDSKTSFEQIVPYVQQGNLVFTGEGGEYKIDQNDSSDEELAQNIRRNGDERKMVLTELKHVIDTQPTCLYEDDYQEFKKSGLLNPTKEDIRDISERSSDDDEDDFPDLQRSNFNPFSFPLTSMHSLHSEMLECEEFVGEGDISDASTTD